MPEFHAVLTPIEQVAIGDEYVEKIEPDTGEMSLFRIWDITPYHSGTTVLWLEDHPVGHVDIPRGIKNFVPVLRRS